MLLLGDKAQAPRVSEFPLSNVSLYYKLFVLMKQLYFAKR
jgi:hypothetical protein